MDGEEQAFDTIFRKYYALMSSLAHSFVKDPLVADSLVEDCFVKLWEKRTDLSDVQKLGAYLFSIVRNYCIDYLRKEKSLKNLYKNLPASMEENNTMDQVLANDFEDKLLIALNKLPERCRIAFIYNRFENLKYADIALKMGITEKAVEANIGRALKYLRIALSDFLR